MPDNRRSPRKTADRILWIQLESKNYATVLNFSDEGLGFRALNPVKKSGTIRFSFSDNERRSASSGELVWIDSARKTGGLSFASLSRTNRERIRKWVDQVTPPEGPVVASEAAPPPWQESPSWDEGTNPANSRPASYVPPPGVPFSWSVDPGLPQYGENSQYARYGWDQEMAYPFHRRKFFRGFVTGAIVSVVFAAILLFAFGNSPGLSLARGRLGIGPDSVPQTAPIAPPPVAAPPPLASRGLPASGDPEAPIVSAPLPAPADDFKTYGATGSNATVPPPSQDSAAPGNLPPKGADAGDSDLALAQRYLNDKTGPGNAAAARSLWAAVEKGNVNAEIMLADLYARGDGVAKSCNQARVLLQAAARKGSSEASQELARIIRSGCR